MKICIVETESQETEFFREALEGEFEMVFADGLDEVPEDAEMLSVFVHSVVNGEFIAAHPKLKMIATRSSGFDHIALPAAAAAGITVCNVVSYGENTVAEHSFALLLAVSRRLRESLAAQTKLHFSYEALRGFDLMGKTIGIVGTGHIGMHAARIARGFQMNVLAYDLKTQPLVAATLDFQYVSFEELLRQSDVVSLFTPLTPETRHIINRETLAMCKRGMVLINTARGALVDTTALLEALESGQLGGAGLDVLEDERVLQQEGTRVIGNEIVSHIQNSTPDDGSTEPLQQSVRVEELKRLVSNSRLIERCDVIFTPHSAFNSAEAVERIDAETVRNIRAFNAGAPVNVVREPRRP